MSQQLGKMGTAYMRSKQYVVLKPVLGHGANIHPAEVLVHMLTDNRINFPIDGLQHHSYSGKYKRERG